MAYPVGTVSVHSGLSKYKEVCSTGGTFTWTCPSVATDGFDVVSIDIIECWGAGGLGGATSGIGGTTAGSGGGGGAYARKTSSFSVTPGTTYTIKVGTHSDGTRNSFFSATTVVNAVGGNPANTTTVGTGGSSASCTGDVTFSGANGANNNIGTGGAGGGGAGSGANASGQSGGATDATLGSGAGGNGGNAGSVGGSPGGGGGGANALGSAGNGGAGRVVLYYNKRYGTSISESAILSDSNTTNLTDGTFEGGTTESFSGANWTFANINTQAQSGSRSLQLTANNTNSNKFAVSDKVAVTAGTYYECSSWHKAAVTARLITPQIAWYSDAAGTTLISTINGSAIADGTSGWTQMSVVGIAPAGAVSCRYSSIYANSALNEVHYIDTVRIAASGWARQFTGARSGAEAINAPTDATARLYGANRSIAQSINAPTESITRAFVGARSLSEAISAAADSVARLFVGTRGTSESVSTPSDAVARSLTVGRTIVEVVAAVSDTVTRSFVGARTLSEAVSVVSEAIARSAGTARVINESVAATTDSTNRVLNANRTISENVNAPTDSAIRTATFNRSLSEAIAIPSETVVRSVGAARFIAEIIAVPVDAVGRTVTFNRVVEIILPGEGGGVINIIKKISAIWED